MGAVLTLWVGACSSQSNYEYFGFKGFEMIEENVKKLDSLDFSPYTIDMTQEQKQRFTDLAARYGLTKDDFWKSPQGFVIISRRGIEKIQSQMNARVEYEVVDSLCDTSKSFYVIKATGTVRLNPEMFQRYAYDQDSGEVKERLGLLPRERVVETYGESSPKNTRGGAQSYPIAMAEKRALSRCILKLSDFYQLEVFGEDEVQNDE